MVSGEDNIIVTNTASTNFTAFTFAPGNIVGEIFNGTGGGVITAALSDWMNLRKD